LRDRARALLVDLGLKDKLGLKPNQLSGGEKQRVAIARALFSDPAIVLADEPTASLDAASSAQISAVLAGLAYGERRTVVVVSHDPRWTQFASRTVVLNHGRITENRSGVQ